MAHLGIIKFMKHLAIFFAPLRILVTQYIGGNKQQRYLIDQQFLSLKRTVDNKIFHMSYSDLTHEINENTPVYPGDPLTSIQQNATLSKDNYAEHIIGMGTHTGTHIDAPSHMLKNGKALNQFPLEKFTGRGVYIKIERGKFDLSKIKTIAIKKNDIVFFHTGMSNSYKNPEYFTTYPTVPQDVANYLIKKGISIVGVDSCSVDHEEFTIHKLFLQNDILIIENLTNLASLTGKKFTVSAFPLNLNLDGLPVGVVAQIET